MNAADVISTTSEREKSYTTHFDALEESARHADDDAAVSDDWIQMEFHEATNIFPMMGEAELSELAEDIKRNGLKEKIWTYQGKIIDGRNRYVACKQAVVPPAFREWDGNGSLVAWVASLNLHRRHLTESQRAMVGAKIRPMFEDEARKNLSLGGQGLANLPKVHSRDQAAKAVNVSSRTVGHASKVLAKGTEELAAAVESGKVAVSAAAEISTLPKAEQIAIVAGGDREIVEQVGKIKRAQALSGKGKKVDRPATVPQPEETKMSGPSFEQIKESIARMDSSTLVALLKLVAQGLLGAGMDRDNIIETVKGLGFDDGNGGNLHQ